MPKEFNTLVIGGGCLGCACAFSISRQLGRQQNKVAIIEKKVLAAGLSSRHSAIVRSANASPMAARMAKIATEQWKSLKTIWGVDIPFERPGAIWITENSLTSATNKWQLLERTMQKENIALQRISKNEATDLCNGAIRVDHDEMYFYEPDVLQLNSSEILNALQNAARINGVEIIEHCEVYDFERDSHGNIVGVHTNQGKISCKNIVNAAGGWSSDLFATIDIHIPVALEPVYVANFLVSFQEVPESLPIIADFVNGAYFRRWLGSILHMHQPRSRSGKEIARSFSRALMNPEGANVIYDALNFSVNPQKLDHYLKKVENRFPKLSKAIYAGGYQSFFDITPDLKFILGKDAQVNNLFHCLGAGQALKYAPVFGELIADLVTKGSTQYPDIDISEFSIGRFQDKAMEQFWTTDTDNNYFL
ncbi:NAD(P)/FAD-dependent oxidoreductase [Crenothrix sp.]|uniref:NAD(P)/FAD-dependent oxidoreductase n=1 Tax=Crenothrix sp. TaxID=3100433 RepID=UPI00374D6DC0